MSGRKNNLLKYQTVTSQAMTANITSAVSNIAYLDNIGIQMNFTGNPEGTFALQVSADYAADNQGNVTNTGNWIDLLLPATPSATGTANQIYFDLNQLSAPWIRLAYTNTFLATGQVNTVHDVAGSLAGTFFKLTGADGDKWAPWFKVSGTGTAPVIAGFTAVEVDISTGDTANAVATALRTALAAVTSIGTIGGTTNHVTFTNVDPGVFVLIDGSSATGFTFTNTNTTGVLNAFITGKML